jgi:hypothetical protein
MEQHIHGYFREAQCMVVILQKPVTFVVKIAKISRATEALVCQENEECQRPN